MTRIDVRELSLAQRVIIPRNYLKTGPSTAHSKREGEVRRLWRKFPGHNLEIWVAEITLDEKLFGETNFILQTEINP